MHAPVDRLKLGSIFRHPGSKEDLRTCLYSSHAPICVCHHESIKKVTNCEYLADGYKTSIALWSKSRLAPPVKPVEKENENLYIHQHPSRLHSSQTQSSYHKPALYTPKYKLLQIQLPDESYLFCQVSSNSDVSQVLFCEIGTQTGTIDRIPAVYSRIGIIWPMFDGLHSVCL